ncbi:hypothetical protein J2045_004645 [Peteryoungia aggregata LMG 23059]|uniref:Uncharacterized protein n=1 Tax=Peteryoungia aggregata LMG 23059 TaxID=1368425 RepID=A0ABU0GDZ6_9HYPH|nr:hypothetical protein [Peteryoungia aggregata]MDQ0423590.1 hypothetical protein [Peteryoungia aggregata LMG 23059]
MQQIPDAPEFLDHSEIDALGNETLPLPKYIDLSFFSHKTRKSTQLVGNESESNSYKAKREWMQFDFNELLYVTDLIIDATGYDDYHEVELSYIEFISNSTKTDVAKYVNGQFRFAIGRFIGGFGLRPSSSWTKDSRLTAIRVEGLQQQDFSAVVSLYNDVSDYKIRVEEHLNGYLARAKEADSKFKTLNANIEKIEAKITVRSEELGNIEAELARADALLETRKKEIAVAESLKRTLLDENQSARNNVNALRQASENFSKEISDKEAQLRALKNDINLFPADLSGYVSQGASNARMYYWLSIVPLLVVVFVTARLFFNSEKFIDFAAIESFDVYNYIVSRLPYVLVSLAILAVSYAILNRLISEIIGINRRRQDLFKISIIATDISYASQTNLDLDEEQIFSLRTQVKMELLKEHLRRHIGEDFQFNHPKSWMTKIVSKFANGMDRDSATDKAQE